MTAPSVPFLVRAVYLRRPWWLPPYIADPIIGLTTTSHGERGTW